MAHHITGMTDYLQNIRQENRLCASVASTKETTLIGHISDVVLPVRGTDFVA